MTRKMRKYMYNTTSTGISDKRFSELVRLGESVCRTFVNDFHHHPEFFHGKIDNLKEVILSLAPTHIGVSVKSSKNAKVNLIEEKVVMEAATNLLDEFCAFAATANKSVP